jgi:ABC-2 type transport system ATP-binding protein
MGAPAILVDALEKYFPPALSGWRALAQPFSRPSECALAGITFSISQGQAVALVGPNGAGKSTLLRILATLILPTSGRAALSGFDVARQSAGARRQFGYHTGGDEGFYTRLTALENLAFFAAMNNISGPESRQRISRVAEWLGLFSELDRQVRTLSTGITHRLGLARALLHSPSLLLLDEPTRSLDPIAAADFRRLLKDEIVRRNGTTLLFASHSLAEVSELADRVILLHQGRILADDSPRGLCSSANADTLDAAIVAFLRRGVPSGAPA